MFAKQAALALAFSAAASAGPMFPMLKVNGTAGIAPTGARPTGTGGVRGPTGTVGFPGPTGTGTPGAPKLGGVAAWWGQSGGNLSDVCNDDSFSTIILSFVNNYFGAGGYPAMNLAGSVAGQSPAQQKAGATDLLDGTPLQGAIKTCHQKGKKVFISLGGENAAPGAKLANDDEASKLADSIWNLFLGGTSNTTTAPLRPFGDIVLDGVDLDIENKAPDGYSKFIDTMRAHFKTDRMRDYYISAAPQCPRLTATGDASMPDSTLQKVDIAWVQFYNNDQAKCNHGQDGFLDSVKAWSKAISPAQLWIAAPGDPTKASATTGYIDATAMQKEIKEVYKLNLPNLGGYALWDAATAMNNTAMPNTSYPEVIAKAIKADNTTLATMRRRRY